MPNVERITGKRLFAATIAGLGLLPFSANAAPDYVASLLEVEEDLRGWQQTELDGDDRIDLLLNVWSPERGRELLVYLQGDNGRFPAQPSSRVEIKRDILAYGLADVREEPGRELIFLSPRGAYSYSTRQSGYTDNLEKLFDWTALPPLPEMQSLPYLGTLPDLNGDGRADLLLPGAERYGVFRGGEAGFRQTALLPRPHSEPGRDGGNPRFEFSSDRGLRFAVERPSAFADLLPARQTAEESELSFNRFQESAYLLELERWLPAVHWGQLDGDEEADLLWVDDRPDGEADERRLNLLFRDEDDWPEQPQWQSPLPADGHWALEDLDGDGLDDLLLLENRGGDASLRIFLNRGGRFEFSSADQAMRFSGYELRAQFQDLDGDGRLDMVVSHYSLDGVEALRASMLRTTLIYPGQQGGDTPFASRPAARFEDSFSANNVKGLVERLHFSADLDGNGRPEMLGLDDGGALEGRALDENFRAEEQPMWRFAPRRLVQRIEPVDLNSDGRSDLLLRHQDALTVLVSRHDSQ